MQLTLDQLQHYADELPIGYYANSRVVVKIDENAPTSYFTPSTREIYISLNGVNDSLAKVKDSAENAEVAVRAHLYHELSHALLTPRELQVTDIINIFEDERIETLLKNYYKKVNFRNNIIALCDYNGEKPTTADEVFFYAVRFRATTKEINEKINALIAKHKGLNWNSDVWNSTYIYDINNLYNEITNAPLPNDEEWEQMKANSPIFNQGGEGVNGDIPQEFMQGNGGEQGEGNSAQGKGTQTKDSESGEEIEGEGNGGHGAGRGIFESALDQAYEQSIDTDFYREVESILLNFKKRNQKGGSAMQSYGGVFNPRNCGRDDYRYFDRKATVNGTNPYGSVHLNLFIDDSGSFNPNAKRANKVIGTLCELERKYPFFTVDFALCGDKVTRVEKKDAFVNAHDGTSIQSGAINIVKSMQKKNTYVYNIVLYDGWAHYPSSFKHCYEPWDMPNATLILDDSCAPYAKNCESAKVIISRNYLPTLTKNIIKTLQTAFR